MLTYLKRVTCSLQPRNRGTTTGNFLISRGTCLGRITSARYIGSQGFGSLGGTVQPFVLAPNTLPYNVKKINIYVNGRVGFLSNFEPLKTSWEGTANDITKVAVDKDDPYFASLLAACIISHVGGISRKHLTGDSKVITSIARYYIYFHMRRFTDDPRKMSRYITDNIKELIKANLQTKTEWVHKFVSTRANISYWYYQQPNRHNIRNY